MSEEKTQQDLIGDMHEAAFLFQEAIDALHKFNNSWAEGKLRNANTLTFSVCGHFQTASSHGFSISPTDLGVLLPVIAKQMRLRVEDAKKRLDKAMEAYNENRKKS